MDTQVEQLKQHIAELVEVRRDWMVTHESRVVSAADIKEIEDTAGALGAAMEALDAIKFEIEAREETDPRLSRKAENRRSLHCSISSAWGNFQTN